MDKDDWIIFLLVVIVLILLFRMRKSSTFTPEQVNKIQSSVEITLLQTNDMENIVKIIDIIIAQLNKEESYSKMNELIDITNNAVKNINTQGADSWRNSLKTAATNTPLAKYTSEQEFSDIFTKAFNETETNLNPRDKLCIRFFIIVPVLMTGKTAGAFGVDVTPTSDGKAQWADQWVTDSGKDAKTMLMFGFNFLKILFSSSAVGHDNPPWPQNLVDMTNEVLPKKFEKFKDGSELRDGFMGRNSNDGKGPKTDAEKESAQSPSPSSVKTTDQSEDRITWVFKAITIGPIYINWLAEQKWKIDPGFDIGEAYGLARRPVQQKSEGQQKSVG